MRQVPKVERKTSGGIVRRKPLQTSGKVKC